MADHDDLCECARDLITAVFRLAVCDYLGIEFGEEDGNAIRRKVPHQRDEAAAFLTSGYAEHMAFLAGFSSAAVWKEVLRRSAIRHADGPRAA